MRRPRAWHFGLRRTQFWPAVGWAALGLVTFYVLVAIYSALLTPDVEQTVAEDLGADDGSFGLIAAGFMIICVAPSARSSSSAASSTARCARASRLAWRR